MCEELGVTGGGVVRAAECSLREKKQEQEQEEEEEEEVEAEVKL